jgi:hypothetical protein
LLFNPLSISINNTKQPIKEFINHALNPFCQDFTAQYTGVVFSCLPDLLALAKIGLNLAMNDLFLAGIFFLMLSFLSPKLTLTTLPFTIFYKYLKLLNISTHGFVKFN